MSSNEDLLNILETIGYKIRDALKEPRPDYVTREGNHVGDLYEGLIFIGDRLDKIGVVLNRIAKALDGEFEDE